MIFLICILALLQIYVICAVGDALNDKLSTILEEMRKK